MNEKGTSKMSTRKEDAMMKMKGIGYWATCNGCLAHLFSNKAVLTLAL
jgi:hypothetical protein